MNVVSIDCDIISYSYYVRHNVYNDTTNFYNVAKSGPKLLLF